MAISTFTTKITGGGKIQASNATYLTARNATTGTVSTETSRPGNSNIAGTYYVGRGFCTFDLTDPTSGLAIPVGSTIIEGANTFIRAVGVGAAQNVDTDSLTLVASTPASNISLTGNDFDNIGSTQFVTALPFASWNGSGNNDIQLNATAIAALVLAAFNAFAWRTTKDIAGTQPTNYNWTDMADGTNLLSIEYTPPAVGRNQAYIVG